MIEQAGALLFHGEQSLDLLAQVFIPTTGVSQEVRALLRFQFQGGVKELLDFPQPLRFHGSPIPPMIVTRAVLSGPP
jgi:hypothetical protein